MEELRTWGWVLWFPTVCAGLSCCPSAALLSLLLLPVLQFPPLWVLPVLLHLNLQPYQPLVFFTFA